MNIFIGVAPIQLYQIPLIIKKNHDNNYVFIFSKKLNKSILQIDNAEVYYYDTSNIIRNIKSLVRFKIKLNEILSNRDFNLYIPHPFHQAANYTVFFRNPKNTFLLADGILNYSEKKINYKDIIYMIIKKIISILLGLNYKIYFGGLTGKEYIKYKEQIPLYLQKMDIYQNASADDCLFLDQDLSKLNLNDKIECFYDKAVKYLVERKFKKIFYKSHPSVNNENNIFINKIKKLTDIELEVIDDPSPIESVIQEYPVEEVISFISSPLMNLKDIDEKLITVSITGEKILKEIGREELIGHFQQKGVLFYE
ncbi:polysialyltransferase family glycosyltransferase [Bacillus sp. DTU_2020_1000418_1_SI_GHA_SEK_038]|uniref:polysialyltransferase family glycosyltransferase n=1 Tax=Bacillus sp. DTU_2020_1000418_1_SI_GHA_SEK_038 TaxID=3077585 RepID=UPI0028E570E7|nr:polysialyltransferase family glycosyltransferase [Bacillus sp. DTU_2020_1000418_1_SI_GHA_SEK_038]WNS75206.1 polysialyltransferase family glycosyltransferase [Bacillus sp. DTU_2020_1000418_1_SI_GHA_SEK_038]